MTEFFLAAWLAANNASYAKTQVFRPGSGEHIFTNFSGRNCLPVFRHDGNLHSDNRTGGYAVSYNGVPGQPKKVTARIKQLYKNCEYSKCGKVISVGRNSKRRYCNVACKQAAYRDRNPRTVLLSSEIPEYSQN